MIAILLLKMLGLQEHPLAPKNRAKLVHPVPPSAPVQHTPLHEVCEGLGKPLGEPEISVGPEIDDFNPAILVSTLGGVVRRDRFALAKAPSDETL
jgi:hypothetical protein